MREENISGLSTLEFIPVSDVLSIARPWKEKIASAVSLKPSKSFFSLAYTQETADFSCEPEKTPNGSIHKLSVTAFIPKMQLATDQTLSEMRDDLFILKVRDNNGNVRLCGTIEAPIRFEYNENALAEFGRRGGYSIRFFRDLASPPPYYTA